MAKSDAAIRSILPPHMNKTIWGKGISVHNVLLFSLAPSTGCLWLPAARQVSPFFTECFSCNRLQHVGTRNRFLRPLHTLPRGKFVWIDPTRRNAHALQNTWWVEQWPRNFPHIYVTMWPWRGAFFLIVREWRLTNLAKGARMRSYTPSPRTQHTNRISQNLAVETPPSRISTVTSPVSVPSHSRSVGRPVLQTYVSWTKTSTTNGNMTEKANHSKPPIDITLATLVSSLTRTPFNAHGCKLGWCLSVLLHACTGIVYAHTN